MFSIPAQVDKTVLHLLTLSSSLSILRPGVIVSCPFAVVGLDESSAPHMVVLEFWILMVSSKLMLLRGPVFDIVRNFFLI